ncbi:vacuolar cation/proton exchanger 1-like isoform X2 [Cynara cardunculus var. scolymus]|uniref:vacuolar cation/proton exchanger 1-like isoform X2 n=1 Tax=Cynara cardunculus var. scolymus TaxID=59895 RepID=UPI000D629BA9|nr:vacuolar cation/proton exchanger 1-like isoform X2 [Cynara cardunculus var. scolymus]
MASSATQPWLLENGTVKRLTKDSRRHGHGRSVHNMSSSSLRKKSDMSLVSKVPFSILRNFLTNLQEVILGTKLSLLFIAIPIAIAAHHFQFSRPWIFSTSLIGLIPLAERVSFLTEQIAFYTGGTVGGLLNATCGNATELIIAIFALIQHKVDVVKYSLLGSILSNLLLVLGSSLLCGGLANLSREQTFDRVQEEDEDDLHESEVESPQIGFWSALIWLIGMTAIIALLSEYLVNTIEAASSSWGMPLSFISIILLPIVGNAAEHAGAVIFAFKNKLDITLGVALGSATQIAVFVVPVTVLVAWIIGINLDLDFNLVETGSFSLTILVTAFALQDGTSHYLKGVVLLLFYVVIGVVFFVTKSSFDHEDNALNTKVPSSNGQIFAS